MSGGVGDRQFDYTIKKDDEMAQDKWLNAQANWSDTMFLLQRHPEHQITVGVVVTPEPTDRETVAKAWSYALKHSPVTLDQPDYAKAFALLRERHPDWDVLGTGDGKRITEINYSVKLADEDVSDGDG